MTSPYLVKVQEVQIITYRVMASSIEEAHELVSTDYQTETNLTRGFGFSRTHIIRLESRGELDAEILEQETKPDENTSPNN